MNIQPDSLEFAWATGLFEGEGCIYVGSNGNGHLHRRLMVVSTDLDVLEKFARILDAGRIDAMKMSALGKKPRWCWISSRWDEVEPILTAILPALSARRREKAEELLANPPRTPSPGYPRRRKKPEMVAP